MHFTRNILKAIVRNNEIEDVSTSYPHDIVYQRLLERRYPQFDRAAHSAYEKELRRWYGTSHAMIKNLDFDNDKLRKLYPLIYASSDWIEHEHNRLQRKSETIKLDWVLHQMSSNPVSVTKKIDDSIQFERLVPDTRRA